MNRIIWIVIDSVGVGALPDAKSFGDEGVNTLGHIVKEFNDIKWLLFGPQDYAIFAVKE